MARIEIVRTDADQPFHARFVATNGRTIATSEKYADRRAALSAVAVVAEAFGITMGRPPTEQDDPEAGELGIRGEAPDGNVYTYGVVDVDEREGTAPE